MEENEQISPSVPEMEVDRSAMASEHNGSSSFPPRYRTRSSRQAAMTLVREEAQLYSRGLHRCKLTLREPLLSLPAW